MRMSNIADNISKKFKVPSANIFEALRGYIETGGISTAGCTTIADLVDKLPEISSGGGGNPNYSETIVGTLSSPFGKYTSAQLQELIAAGDATVQIYVPELGFTSNASLMVESIYPNSRSMTFSGFTMVQSYGVEGYALRYGASDSSLVRFSAVMGGQAEDYSDLDGSLITSLTVFHHPRKEES